MIPFRRVLLPYLPIIRNRRYFPLWLAQLVSSLGDTLNYIALVIYVYQLTGSGFDLSKLSLFQIIPILLIAPLAGVIIDRFRRKNVLIAADIARAILMLGLATTSNVTAIYAIAVLVAIATTFFRPTVQAVIPAIVEEDELLAANSVAWSTEQVVQIIGSAVAGGLIVLVGPQAAFVFNAGTFLFSALMISTMDVPAVPIPESEKKGWRLYVDEMRAGLAYARRDVFVSRLIVVQMIASLAVGGTSALLVVLSEQHLQLPPAGFSTLLLAIGIGALLGPFFLGLFTQNYKDMRLLFVPYLIRGVGDVLIAWVVSYPFALFLLFVYGLNTSTGMVIYNSIMQSSVPDRVKGRVFTLMDMAWSVMQIVSIGVAGVLADVIGIRSVYYLGDFLLIVAGGIGLVALGRYRFVISPPADSSI
ncbi:MAG TPA: MFS transporter [Anaerolineae bacterium]|nr:MFS transporter [Anaerolineae bacterium]